MSHTAPDHRPRLREAAGGEGRTIAVEGVLDGGADGARLELQRPLPGERRQLLLLRAPVPHSKKSWTFMVLLYSRSLRERPGSWSLDLTLLQALALG